MTGRWAVSGSGRNALSVYASIEGGCGSHRRVSLQLTQWRSVRVVFHCRTSCTRDERVPPTFAHVHPTTSIFFLSPLPPPLRTIRTSRQPASGQHRSSLLLSFSHHSLGLVTCRDEEGGGPAARFEPCKTMPRGGTLHGMERDGGGLVPRGERCGEYEGGGDGKSTCQSFHGS